MKNNRVKKTVRKNEFIEKLVQVFYLASDIILEEGSIQRNWKTANLKLTEGIIFSANNNLTKVIATIYYWSQELSWIRKRNGCLYRL